MLNKVDLMPAEEREQRVKDFVKRLRWKGPVFKISALTREGLRAADARGLRACGASSRTPLPDEPDPRFDAATPDGAAMS